LSTERLLNSSSSPQRRYTSGASRVYLDDDSRREFSIEVLELIVSHAPPVVTNGDLSIRPKVGRDFVFGIFLLGPQAIQGQASLGTKIVDFGTLGDFSRYIASFLFQGWYRNS
jgi:hypothetical protein